MEEQLGGQVTDPFAAELGIPDQPGTTRKIDGRLRQGLVHGQQKAVAGQAALVAQGLGKGGAQGQRRILHGVVLVDVQVAGDANAQIDAAVPAELLQHVVEKPQAGVDVGLPGPVQVEANGNLGFVGGALDDGHAGRVAQEAVDGVPIGGGEGGARVGGLRQQNGLATQILGQLYVGQPVAEHKGRAQVVAVGRVEVAAQ